LKENTQRLQKKDDCQSDTPKATVEVKLPKELEKAKIVIKAPKKPTDPIKI